MKSDCVGMTRWLFSLMGMAKASTTVASSSLCCDLLALLDHDPGWSRPALWWQRRGAITVCRFLNTASTQNVARKERCQTMVMAVSACPPATNERYAPNLPFEVGGRSHWWTGTGPFIRHRRRRQRSRRRRQSRRRPALISRRQPARSNSRRQGGRRLRPPPPPPPSARGRRHFCCREAVGGFGGAEAGCAKLRFGEDAGEGEAAEEAAADAVSFSKSHIADSWSLKSCVIMLASSERSDSCSCCKLASSLMRVWSLPANSAMRERCLSGTESLAIVSVADATNRCGGSFWPCFGNLRSSKGTLHTTLNNQVQGHLLRQGVVVVVVVVVSDGADRRRRPIRVQVALIQFPQRESRRQWRLLLLGYLEPAVPWWSLQQLPDAHRGAGCSQIWTGASAFRISSGL